MQWKWNWRCFVQSSHINPSQNCHEFSGLASPGLQIFSERIWLQLHYIYRALRAAPTNTPPPESVPKISKGGLMGSFVVWLESPSNNHPKSCLVSELTCPMASLLTGWLVGVRNIQWLVAGWKEKECETRLSGFEGDAKLTVLLAAHPATSKDCGIRTMSLSSCRSQGLTFTVSTWFRAGSLSICQKAQQNIASNISKSCSDLLLRRRMVPTKQLTSVTTFDIAATVILWLAAGAGVSGCGSGCGCQSCWEP